MQKENRLGRILHPSIYKEGKGDVEPLPAGGPKLFFFLLGNYFFKLVGLNLLTLLLCIPVVTIPASLTALSRVLMKYAMQGYCSPYQEYFQEWKSGLVRYLPFFLLTALPVVGSVLLVYGKIQAITGIAGFALVAVSAIVFLFVYQIWCYAFPLFAMIDLPVLQNVKNALYFVATQRRANFALMIPVVLWAVCLVFWPWTMPVFALLLLSVPALIICCIVKPPIERDIIKPYGNQAEPSASDNETDETDEKQGE